MSETYYFASPRSINIYFIREYKHFFNKGNKKCRSDYILNINKIIKEKFNKEVYILNNIQAFLLNYEVKKLLDKAITISNEKYENVVYINNSLSITGMINIYKFLIDTYKDIGFNFILLDKDNEFSDIAFKIPNINIIKALS